MMEKKSCYNCSHRYVCKYMNIMEKFLEELPTGIRNIYSYEQLYIPFLQLLADKCSHYGEIKKMIEWIKIVEQNILFRKISGTFYPKWMEEI